MSGATPFLIAASTAVSMAASSQKAKAQNRARMAQHEQQQKQAALARRIEKRKIAREKKQALARQRARFGSAGLSSSSGSSAAVLSGLSTRFAQQDKESQSRFELASGQAPDLLDPSLDMLATGLSGARRIVGYLPE